MALYCLCRKCINPKNSHGLAGVSTDAQNSTSLEKLTQNLRNDLAEQVKQCWIEPQRISFEKYLGHGTNFGDIFLFSRQRKKTAIQTNGPFLQGIFQRFGLAYCNCRETVKSMLQSRRGKVNSTISLNNESSDGRK